jgi:tRNA threonylcarbamoyladenosine modification (KEOPS) complex Cgi121 subunit/molybdopterin converting factor small subunit
MITIRLLGGAKKAVGKSVVDFDTPSASVTEILQFLTGISADSRLLHPRNLIVAVNGIDSGALQGRQTLAKSGDTVTIVTVVHGGAIHMLDRNYVSITGVTKITEDTGKLVDRLRAKHKDVSIQLVNTSAFLGIDHLLGVLRVTLEAEKRKIMLANRPETELLVRLACTGHISEAMKRAGLKKDEPGCFVAFSANSKALDQFVEQVEREFGTDDSVLDSSIKKKLLLANMLRIDANLDDDEFMQHLLERAAILVK